MLFLAPKVNGAVTTCRTSTTLSRARPRKIRRSRQMLRRPTAAAALRHLWSSRRKNALGHLHRPLLQSKRRVCSRRNHWAGRTFFLFSAAGACSELIGFFCFSLGDSFALKRAIYAPPHPSPGAGAEVAHLF